MSELISGADALRALADGKEVEFNYCADVWHKVHKGLTLDCFDKYKFRLKPRTINLNGVEVGMIYKSEWESSHPTRVILEFKTTKDALHFSSNISRIFKAV